MQTSPGKNSVFLFSFIIITYFGLLSAQEYTSSSPNLTECSPLSGGLSILSGTRKSRSIKPKIDSIARSAFRKYKRKIGSGNPYAGGSICTYFTIGCNGRISDVQIIENTVHDTHLEEYLIKKLSNLKFRRLRSCEEGTEVSKKFSFKIDKHHNDRQQVQGCIRFSLVLIPLISLLIMFKSIGNAPY